jgi:flavin reductase (DIM6/NTAB) family NADH-FMN oxidoreductase RutF
MGPETTDAPLWPAALGRIPSGLFIVTARHRELETGMLASWVQQCSFEPPQITLAIKRGRDVGSWITGGDPFVVNILGASQTDLIGRFARGFDPGEPAFDGLAIERSANGVPVLSAALAWLECRAIQTVEVGDHDLFIALVQGGQLLRDGEPRVHIRKNGLKY